MPLRFFRCIRDSFVALLPRLIGFNLELQDLQFGIVGRTLKAGFDELKRSSQLALASQTLRFRQSFPTFPRGSQRLPRLLQKLRLRELFQALVERAQRLVKLTFPSVGVGFVFNLNDPLLPCASFRKGQQIIDLTLLGILRCRLAQKLCRKNRLTLV
jgi:hypothetical protein